jgi:hypothetical protein
MPAGPVHAVTNEIVERRYPGYRGARIVDVGVSLARDGRIDARLIGDASHTGRYEERDLKHRWHYLARFGSLGV